MKDFVLNVVNNHTNLAFVFKFKTGRKLLKIKILINLGLKKIQKFALTARIQFKGQLDVI